MESGAAPHAKRATKSVVTIGTYDGVHLGHRRLIEETMHRADAAGAKSIVVTFGVHPSAVLRPDIPVGLLCTQEQKMALLRATGIDEIVVLGFDEDRARESAEDFVRHELHEELGVIEVVVGSNFRFGHARSGDVALLEKMGEQLSFTTHGVELVLDDELHSVVSSTRIRALISAGELHEAGRLLGRPVSLSGVLNSSGAFVASERLLLPGPGQYAVVISAGDDLVLGGPQSGESVESRVLITIDQSGAVIVHDQQGDRPDQLVTMAFLSDREPISGTDQ